MPAMKDGLDASVRHKKSGTAISCLQRSEVGGTGGDECPLT